MLVYVVIGAIAGILLGVSFKVLVLVPAFLLATIVIIANESGHTVSESEIALTVLGTVVSLQIGYMVGSLVRTLARKHLPAAQRQQRVRFALKRLFHY